MGGWIGVDLDGTLATYPPPKEQEIGHPIPAMVARVKKWLAEGKEVRIVTARVGRWDGMEPEQESLIEQQIAAVSLWCLTHLGAHLPVQAHKDFRMVELWDDRAVRVQRNTGELLSPAETWPPGPTPKMPSILLR